MKYFVVHCSYVEKKSPKDADLRIRVSKEMKAEIVALMIKEDEAESVIVRKAIRQYLDKFGGYSAPKAPGQERVLHPARTSEPSSLHRVAIKRGKK
ncbi:MAG: hypothetical protein WCS65_13310 [Verrucomicrobiae bacterium]